MDVAYPFKKRGDCSELRYSLRSLVNLEHDEVWIVGDKPPGIVTRRINLALPGYNYANVCNNVLAACNDKRISDPFIVMNDDFFVMEPIAEVPTLYRETLDESVKRYAECGMWIWHKHTRDIMRAFPDAVRSYELHIPMVVHKDAMIEAIGRGGLGPMWRTAYGAVLGLEGTRTDDCKVRKLGARIPSGPFLSTADETFDKGEAGELVRARFPLPSRYEQS